MPRYTSFLLSLFLLACSGSKTPSPKKELAPETLSYLALGDSYTIGESVAEAERWPNLLADTLAALGHKLTKPQIIARTGWRTDQLIDAMASTLKPEAKYDLVSVLIGVNNQFQHKPIAVYKKELMTILDQAIARAKKGKSHVFVLSIPDYGATPYGAKQAEEIGQAIDQWNTACAAICKEKGIAYYDITDISRQATSDAALVAPDGLHPSGKMYKRWVDRIIKAVELLCQ
jgi:acyl-CoA thioesterase-1